MARYPGNHTDSELLSVPRFLKTRPGAPQTHLAYITDSEAQSLGKPHSGPHDIPNYDSFDWTGTSYTGGSNQADVGRDTNRGGGNQGQDRPQNAQQEQRDRQRQEKIDRNNANRIAKIEQDKREAAVASAGRQWDPRADDWAKDYSYSTRDVRSTPQEREKFRLETEQVRYEGDKRIEADHYIETPAEKMAFEMARITGNPKYRNMPIFVPKGVSYEEQEALLKLAKTNPQEFMDTVTQFEDITAGNPNVQFQEGFGTGYDEWYQPKPIQSGGGAGGWSGCGSGGGGGAGGGGGYYGPQPGYKPEQMAGFYTPQANLQQAMINVHQTPTVFKKRGGIVSLLELR